MSDFKKGIFISPELLPVMRVMPAELLQETVTWLINDAEGHPQAELSQMGRIMVAVFSPSVHAAQKVAERRHNAAVKNGKKKGKSKNGTLVPSKKNAVPIEVESVVASDLDSFSEPEEQPEEAKPALKKLVSREKKKTKVQQQTQQQTVAVEDQTQTENEKIEEEKKVEEFKSDNRLFEIFWHAYPNKENKREALEEWTALESSSEWPGLPVILEALRREIFSRGWDTPDAPEDCPLATAWLRFMSWK